MVSSNKEGDGDGGKSNVDGDEGGRQATATRAKATAMRAMATVTGVVCDKEARVRALPKARRRMRVVGDKEGEGRMATVTATRVVGEQLQWQQGWWVRKRARSARVMAMTTMR